MIEIICKNCGGSLDIDYSFLGNDLKIKVESCTCEFICDPEHCDYSIEKESEIMSIINQQHIDIEGNDEKLNLIKKLGKKYKGNFQKEIEDILNKD